MTPEQRTEFSRLYDEIGARDSLIEWIWALCDGRRSQPQQRIAEEIVRFHTAPFQWSWPERDLGEARS